MPVYRRRLRSIAKVNATSIDGYFGEGTPCFFIRGTILSDMPVDGEYRTLSVTRPGNLIEIEDFDGSLATLVITTRPGNRVGDNIRARVRLRDADLRAVGIECERILAGLGSFEQPFDEPEAIVAPESVLSPPVAIPVPVPVAAFAPWTDASDVARDGAGYGSNGTSNGVARAPEREAAPQPTPAPEPRVTEATVVRAVNERGDARTSIIDGKVLIDIGTSVVAIAIPVVLFFLRSLFSKRDNR
jgi:hypothetical protein